MSDSEHIIKTCWFASTTKPAREGFYETHWLIGSHSKLRFWDGSAWHDEGKVSSRQDYRWRGVDRLGRDHVAQRDVKLPLIPHEVVSATADGATPTRAWRKHLGLKQAEVAARMGISQPGYGYLERKERLSERSREKVAAALGISAEQLDF